MIKTMKDLAVVYHCLDIIVRRNSSFCIAMDCQSLFLYDIIVILNAGYAPRK
jgi:hypothetical protein